jgi:hypothetical protein
MKLARIEHWRCGEPIGWKDTPGSTYVWVPDDLTEQEFEDLCERARKEYFRSADELKKLIPTSPSGYGPQFENFPDLTVKEVLAIHAEKKKAWDEQQAKRKAAQRSFTEILKDISGGIIKSFWDTTFPLDVKVDWGHNHGVDIQTGAENLGDFHPDGSDERGEDDGI